METPDAPVLDFDEATTAWLDEIVLPIDGDSPTGTKADYQDDYVAVKAEVDLLESVTGGEPNYPLVVERSLKVLRETSKDMRAGGYLAIGLVQTEGVVGLRNGLAALDRLVETFWEDLYPPHKRMQARLNALEFLSRRIKLWSETVTFTLADGEPLEQSIALAERLHQRLIEKLGRQEADRSDLFGMVQKLRAAQRRVPKPAEAPKPPSASPSAASGGGAAAPSPAPRASAGGDEAESGEWRSVADATRTLVQVYTYLSEQDASQALPYRLIRMIRWDSLQDLPPNEGGKTMIEGPPAQRRTFLSGLQERGEHARMAAAAEAAFGESPFHFWLDLQRMVVTGLEARGGTHEAAAQAVLQETAILLRRVPGIVRLSFKDGMPFADALTQAWIEARVRPLFETGGSGEGAAPPGNAADEALEEAYASARDQMLKRDLGAALEMMRDVELGADQRSRFRHQHLTAKLCLQGGRTEVARVLLEKLGKDVDAYRLDDWEPVLAREVWSDLYECFRRQGPASAESPQAVAAFDRVCRLDPAFAVQRFESTDA